MEINSIPPGSYAPPEPQRVSPQEAAQRQELVKAVRAVDASGVFGEQNELVFVLNPATHQAILRLVDRKTREVLMQLPPEYVVRLAEDMTHKT